MNATNRPRVLVTSFYERDIIAESMARLRGFADVSEVNHGRNVTHEELRPCLPGMQAIIAADESYNADLLESADDLVLIAREGTGYDRIDVDTATRLGILLTNAPVVHASTANWTIGLMIALVRRLPQCDRTVRDDRWTDRAPLLRPCLTGSKLGVVGFGQVGQEVARRGSALGMEVLAHNRSDASAASADLGVRLATLDEALAADVVTVHIRHTPETTKMFNADLFARMKRGAYFVNTSRGGIVDEAALFDALQSGHLAGAALDVFVEEPVPADHPLLSLDTVLCSPHVGGETTTTVRWAFDVAVGEVIDCFQGNRPRNLVNTTAWDGARLHALQRGG